MKELDTTDPNADYAARYAFVKSQWDKPGLEEAKQKTHDALIDQLGPQRNSGVRWLIEPAGKAERTLKLLNVPEGDQMYEWCRKWPLGCVVVAMAEVRPLTRQQRRALERGEKVRKG